MRRSILATIALCLLMVSGLCAAKPHQISLLDGNEQGSRFEYDRADRLRAQTGIDGLRTEYELNRLGQPIAVTQAAGTAGAIRIELERDALGRLTGKRTAQTHTRYSYDGGDRLGGIERRLRPGADSLDEAPFEQLPLIDRIELSYDAAGRLSGERASTWRVQQENGWQALREPRETVLSHGRGEMSNPLKGQLGDALHAVLCGARHNLRLILAALRFYCVRFRLPWAERLIQHLRSLRPVAL